MLRRISMTRRSATKRRVGARPVPFGQARRKRKEDLRTPLRRSSRRGLTLYRKRDADLFPRKIQFDPVPTKIPLSTLQPHRGNRHRTVEDLNSPDGLASIPLI